MNAPFALVRESVHAVDLHQPDEAARIEGFVAEHGGSVFHRPAWLLAVEAGTGQRARGLVAEKGGRLTGWLPLTEVHSPIFGRMLASSGFAVEGGVLAQNDVTACLLGDAVQKLALRLSCPTVELRGGFAGEGWQVRQDSHCGFIAPLADDDEAQLTMSSSGAIGAHGVFTAADAQVVVPNGKIMGVPLVNFSRMRWGQYKTELRLRLEDVSPPVASSPPLLAPSSMLAPPPMAALPPPAIPVLP